MSNNCSVCNRLCKFSGAGGGKMVLVRVVTVGDAVLVGWLPHNEQEESSKRISRSGDRDPAWGAGNALWFLFFAIPLFL
jgi:hypothetical protein